MTGAGSIAALSLGSNLGDRARYLAEARAALRALGVLEVLSASPICETEPAELSRQPWFLNQVLLVAARVAPHALLAACRGVEDSLGRLRRVRHGPRTLDLDILFYGETVSRTPLLTLPHPALHRRRCVLVPLADVAPAWRHPLLGKTVLELLAECRDCGQVRKAGEEVRK